MMLVLALGTTISFSSCSKEEEEGNNKGNGNGNSNSIVATWYCEENPEIGGICFNSDGTGYVFFDGKEKKDNFTYELKGGVINFLSGRGYEGMSWQYVIIGNKLVITWNGVSISYSKRDGKVDDKDNSDINSSVTTDTKAVDLGLSVKWASCNIGASSPEEFGDYFAWGETEPYQYGRKYKHSDGYDGTILKASDDVATVKWGENWHTPSVAEMNELKSNCKWTSTTINGVLGYKITGANGNSIFIPTAGGMSFSDTPERVGEYGYYWTSELLNASEVNILKFNSAGIWIRERSMGLGATVRAVCR